MSSEISFIFIISLGFTFAYNNLQTNQKLALIILKIESIQNNYKILTNHYSLINLPSEEVSLLCDKISSIQDTIREIDTNSSGIAIKFKIAIKSLLELYTQKSNSLYAIANNYKDIYLKYLNTNNDKGNTVQGLIAIEKLKIKYLDNNSNIEYFKNRISSLVDISYNLNNPIFVKDANEKLLSFLKYFSTKHISEKNSLDRNILEKEYIILNNKI